MWTGLNRQVELTSVKVDLASLATITGQVPGTPGTHATTCPQELRHGLEGRGPAPPSCRPLWKLQGQRPSRATSPTPVPGAADIAPLTHWELSSNSREDVPGSDGGEPRSDIGTADCHALWSGGSESVSTTRETATREVQCVTVSDSRILWLLPPASRPQTPGTALQGQPSCKTATGRRPGATTRRGHVSRLRLPWMSRDCRPPGLLQKRSGERRHSSPLGLFRDRKRDHSSALVLSLPLTCPERLG
ncbi:uncharacterized protein [Desmodus rotundus]|nr:uncharacterized protein LOC123478587 isoform X3 [Desmodus rotundus]